MAQNAPTNKAHGTPTGSQTIRRGAGSGFLFGWRIFDFFNIFFFFFFFSSEICKRSPRVLCTVEGRTRSPPPLSHSDI